MADAKTSPAEPTIAEILAYVRAALEAHGAATGLGPRSDELHFEWPGGDFVTLAVRRGI